MTQEPQSPTVDEITPGGLDLNTLVDLPDIGLRIDGEWYPYSPHWRWSLLQRARFGITYSDMLDIERKDKPDEKDLARYLMIQVELVKMVAPTLPEEIIRKLPADAQRSAIIIDFLTISGVQALTLIPKEHASMLSFMNASNRIGEVQSRNSRQRTAVPRRRG